MRIRTHALVASIVACVSSISAQTPDSTHRPAPRIIGVFDGGTGAPLPGVQVRDVLSGTFATTTVSGAARLDFLTFLGTAGVVELRKLGYQPKQLVVSRADTAPITELLDPVVTLAPVITTEKYRIDRDAGHWEGFETRCQSKSVTCFRNEDLEKRPTSNIADFLIRADGVTMGACGGGKSRSGQCGKIAMHPVVIPPSYCEPTFFVDGYEWNSRMGGPSDLTPGRPAEAPYTPTNVKGIEVYPPEKPRPLRFQGGDPTCGVVVIWTK